MMAIRAWRVALLGLAVLLAAGAVLMYLSDSRPTTALVLARDVPAGAELAATDIARRSVARGALPPRAVIDPAEAVGMHARGPLPAGQYLVEEQLAATAGRAMAESSFALPAGWSLLALPMEFEHALGGALSPGQSVDVYAVGKRSSGPAEILVPGARLIDVRSPRGQSLALARPDGLDADEPIGSVLVAIPRALLAETIARIESANFVLSAGGDGA